MAPVLKLPYQKKDNQKGDVGPRDLSQNLKALLKLAPPGAFYYLGEMQSSWGWDPQGSLGSSPSVLITWVL